MNVFGPLLWVIGSALITAEVVHSGGNVVSVCAFNIMAVIGGYIHGAADYASKEEKK